MASVSLHAPFSVRIKGEQLVVTQKLDGARRVLCILSLDEQASFFMRDGQVVYRPRFGNEFTLDTASGEDAHALLNQLADAHLQRPDAVAKALAEADSRHADALEDVHAQHAYALTELKSRHAEQLASAQSRQLSPKIARPVGLLALAVMASAFLGVGFGLWLGNDERPNAAGPVSRAVMNEPVRRIADEAVPNTRIEPTNAALAPAQREPIQPAQTPGEADVNGWSLPQAIRATLPDKLRSAAERKLFTVEYSSGHARTVYVFADPACPNCQRLEPALNALSDAFNVVVFPVAVIGKEKSIAAITPVLCLAPEQRKVAWDALFDQVSDGLNVGKVPEQPQKQAAGAVGSNAVQPPGDCEVAEQALGVNQVAYQAYRLPGTPWAIADDGRYVSQALLSDPLQLQTFLDDPVAASGQEVSDGRQ